MSDTPFTDELPTALRAVGVELLRRVRAKWPGHLERTSRGRYVNRPDNFWTVTIRPQAGSLDITVRGVPGRFGASGLQIKADRKGYSRFKVRTEADVGAAIVVLSKADKR